MKRVSLEFFAKLGEFLSFAKSSEGEKFFNFSPVCYFDV